MGGRPARDARKKSAWSREFVTRAGYLQDHLVISGFRVTPAVGFVQPGFKLQLDQTEVEDVFEVPLEFVLDVRNHLPRDRSIAGHTVITHEIPYEGRQIWGATASMLITLRTAAARGAGMSAIDRLRQIMVRLRDPAARLSVGPRAGLGVDRAAHDRGSVRTRRRDRPWRTRGGA